jgi:hypothetical protein
MDYLDNYCSTIILPQTVMPNLVDSALIQAVFYAGEELILTGSTSIGLRVTVHDLRRIGDSPERCRRRESRAPR